MLPVTKVKMSGSEKQNVNRKTCMQHFLHKTLRVSRKFLEVSRCSHAKQLQRNVQKKCAARAELFFLLIRPIVVVFYRSRFLDRFFSITRFHFCLNKV